MTDKELLTTAFFPHDYNARSDEKLRAVFRKYKQEGLGTYWSTLEDLYNNDNCLSLDYEGLSFDLRVEKDILIDIITNFDLFVVGSNSFSSKSVARRLAFRKEKSEKARKSAEARWKKQKELEAKGNKKTTPKKKAEKPNNDDDF